MQSQMCVDELFCIRAQCALGNQLLLQLKKLNNVCPILRLWK